MNNLNRLQTLFYDLSSSDWGIIAIAIVIAIWFLMEIRGS